MAQEDVAITEKCFVTIDTLRALKEQGSEQTALEQQIPWNDDPVNPRNWPIHKKWITTILMSTFLFFTLLASTIAAPTLPLIAKDLEIQSDVETQIVLSIYVLSYAVGSLVFAPLSGTYGRIPVLHATNVLFLGFNTVCGLANVERVMILNSGLLGDCWRREERGRSIAIYSFIPLLGPAIGPVVGGFVARYTTWRWVFYSTGIVQAVMQIPAFLCLRETHHPTLIRRTRESSHKQESPAGTRKGPDVNHQRMSLRGNLLRPLRLLTTQPIVIALSIYIIWQYGILWLMFSSIYSLFEDQYGFPVHIASLCYLSVGLGFFLGTRITALLTDRIYAYYRRKNPSQVEPEVRILLTFPAAILSPAGLLIYGWTVHAHCHPAVPNIGICILSMGFTTGNQCIAAYIVDIYPHYTASAMTAANAVRYVAGFGFPLFAPKLYQTLGYGWGNTLLAGLAFVVGIPGMLIVWKYGPWLRARSKFAAGERAG